MSSMNTEKKRVLVASDDPRVLTEIKIDLMDVFDVNIAAASPAVVTALETYKTSLVVIYIGQNRDETFSMFTKVSELLRSKGIPAIFLAENGTDEDEKRAFEVGAVDYTVRRRGGHDALCSRISLRIRASENEKLLSNAQPGASPNPTPNSPEDLFSGKAILVVDDIELNREIIAGMLEDIGDLTIEFAEDGSEAVEKFSTTPDRYSLILMDVQMPVMDGIEATRAIRSLGFATARDIPIIALTADIDDSEISKYLESGMNDYLQKPASRDELLRVIRS